MAMRRVLSRLILLCFGTAAGLLTCELLLRTFSYAGEHERLNIVFDSEYGDLVKTSWLFQLEIDPSTQEEAVLHGIKVPIKKDPRKTRILFIGDSATAGARVFERGFVFQFKEMLDIERPDNQTEVINAGVWGMTTIGEYRALEGKLLPLEPDIVILGLFMSNDINFNLAHEDERSSSALSRRLFSYLRQHSALVHYSMLRGMALNNRFKLIRSEDVLDWTWFPRELALVDSYGFHMLNYPAGETATYMREPSELMQYAFEVLDQSFQRFLELGEENGFEFRILIIPTPSTVAGELALLHFLPDPYEEIRRQGVDVSSEELDFDLPTQRVMDICRKRRIVCIDPTQRMKEVGMKSFFPDDEHPTALGHEALARELVENYDRLVDGD